MFSLSRSSLAHMVTAAALLASFVPAPLHAQSRSSGELKAAIVLNILRFVDFPGNTTTPLDLCIDSRAQAARQLRALSDQRAGRRLIRTRIVTNRSYRGCEVVFLASSGRAAIRSVQGAGRLVMGNGPDFIDADGTVGLVKTGAQVRFEINLGQANDDGLRISSRLVRLAARVRR